MAPDDAEKRASPLLTPEEKLRYNRQLLLSEIGHQGQVRIKQAKVLIAGLGGLGSLSAYYLAAVGIGHLVIADQDHVSLENLNRQILHRTVDIGRPKTDSARDKIFDLNPLVRIDCHGNTIDASSIDSLVQGCHAIVDATDNHDTRILLNRAALRHRVALVYGGINGWSGMVSTFIPGRTACFECVFDAGQTPAGPIPAIGPVAGAIASIQCAEVIKLILGLTDTLLTDALLYQDFLNGERRRISLEKRPSCRACGQVQRHA